MKYLLSTCLFLSLSAFAETPAWVNDIQQWPYTKTLSRPVDVYNYALRKNAPVPAKGAIDPHEPQIINKLIRQTEAFTNEKLELNQQGPNAIYVATGPFVTREWGSGQAANFNGKDWILTRITLPAGTKFFDARVPHAKVLPSSVRQYIASFGCSASTMSELFQVAGRGDRRQCWNAYTRIAQATGVPMVSKTFYSIAPKYCTNQWNYTADFIIWDPKVVTNYAVFVPEFAAADGMNDERFFIRDYNYLAKQAVAANCGPGEGPFDSSRFGANCTFYRASPVRFAPLWELPMANPDTPEMRRQTESKIFGCGNYKEDVP